LIFRLASLNLRTGILWGDRLCAVLWSFARLIKI